VREILLSTRNPHKVLELTELLGGDVSIVGLDVLPGFAEVEETGSTFAANASLKAEAASLLWPDLVIADDSGLVVEALAGEPGVLSARFAGPAADTPANNRLLLERLREVPAPARQAKFVCVIAVAHQGHTLAHFTGEVTGHILTAPEGEGGFGYDPLFQPEGHPCSFAALPAAEKNRISHRARAVAQLRDWLSSHVA
jgi:XTP/dITP diphosphohydrolase